MAGNAISFGAVPTFGDGDNRLLLKIALNLATGLGILGVDWVTDTAAHVGNWWAFHAVTDCVIAAVSYAPNTSSGSAAGVTVKAGDRLYGQIISLTLTSGTGELYRGGI
jgi:hypothetical protein